MMSTEAFILAGDTLLTMDAANSVLPDGAVLVVCHGTIIRYTLARLAGRPVPGIDNGSISMLRLENNAWQVVTVNGIPLGDIPIEHAARQPSREGEEPLSRS